MPALPPQTVWSAVDREGSGKISFVELGYVLGLISQQQRGIPLDISLLDGQTPPPHLQGFATDGDGTDVVAAVAADYVGSYGARYPPPLQT